MSLTPFSPSKNIMKNKENKLTINALLDASIEQYPDRPALSNAFESPMSYQELGEYVFFTAAYLKEIGVRKKDRIAILAENSANWGIAYLSLMRIGAIAVPILPDFPEADVHHILTDSGVNILFTSQRQLEKLYELRNHKLTNIITLDNSSSKHLKNIIPFSDVILQARELPEKKLNKIKAAGPEVEEEDLASIIYTSGTSGHSKAVMLSHKNFCANVNSASKCVDVQTDWTFLSILPLSHTYEFTIGFLTPLLTGARIVYAGRTPTPAILEKICKEEQPDAMCVVPLVMEKIYKKRILATINDNKLLKLGVKLPWLRSKIMKKIGDKLLDFFGGHLKFVGIGGAPLNIETEKFLREAGFPYIVGYGLSETSPLLAGGPFGDPTISLGSTGKPVPDVEIKINDPDPHTGVGEIFTRGANIMKGYLNNPELTAETIDNDGWLATGDLGSFDEHGNLIIKGRLKSVIVLPHGENIFPEAIEDKINAFVHVAESLVVEKDGTLEARIYPDYDLIDQETSKKHHQKKIYIEQVLKDIQAKVNAELPPYAKIQKIIERPDPFTKTATHKIKRYLYT